jgi:hypothetical protein
LRSKNIENIRGGPTITAVVYGVEQQHTFARLEKSKTDEQKKGS